MTLVWGRTHLALKQVHDHGLIAARRRLMHDLSALPLTVHDLAVSELLGRGVEFLDLPGSADRQSRYNHLYRNYDLRLPTASSVYAARYYLDRILNVPEDRMLRIDPQEPVDAEAAFTVVAALMLQCLSPWEEIFDYEDGLYRSMPTW